MILRKCFISPYLWMVEPSIIYIVFIKIIFYILKFLTGSLDTCLRFFKFLQFDFLPLSIIRMPFIGVINYTFNEEIYKEETMIMTNNIPVFKIGKGTKKMLYIHGGGFVAGDYMSMRSFCLEIYKNYKENDIEIWFPLYSLYPEHCITKAIEELNYIYIYEDFSYIMADSAGGYLALNINNIKENTKVILISPVYDLECSSDAYVYDNIKDINFNKNIVKKIFQSIKHKIKNDISNIDMHIFVSINELFIYDSYKIYSMNNRAILYLYNNSIHSLPLFWKHDTKSQSCLKDILSIL